MTQEIEEAKRKRISELAEETAATFMKVCAHLEEMVAGLGVPMPEAGALVVEHIDSFWAEDAWQKMTAPPKAHPTMAYKPHSVIRATIDRLFAEAPPLTEAEGVLASGKQAPAMKCAVMFRSGAQVEGVLSTTPEGGLRLAVPNKMKTARGEIPVIVEQFFSYADVTAVARVCEVPDMRSNITLATR